MQDLLCGIFAPVGNGRGVFLAMKRKLPPPGSNAAKLERMGITAVCDALREGMVYREIAVKAGVTLSALWRWMHEDEDRARMVRAALQDSADSFDAQAEAVLKEIPDDASKAAVSRARELAQHYRWRASKRNPKAFGDKQQVELEGSLEVALTEEQVDARLLALFAKAGKPAGG